MYGYPDEKRFVSTRKGGGDRPHRPPMDPPLHCAYVYNIMLKLHHLLFSAPQCFFDICRFQCIPSVFRSQMHDVCIDEREVTQLWSNFSKTV